jgi:hypothetical protein
MYHVWIGFASNVKIKIKQFHSWGSNLMLQPKDFQSMTNAIALQNKQ